MPELAIRWMWIYRYKTYFLLLIIFLGIQLFLAYKSSMIPQLSFGSSNFLAYQLKSLSNIKNPNDNSVGDDEDLSNNNFLLNSNAKIKNLNAINNGDNTVHSNVVNRSMQLNVEKLGFKLDCEITTKEAISALQRAKTKDCKKHIATIACLIQNEKFYKKSLISSCPIGNFTANRALGCYQDEKEYRLLASYYTNFKQTNTPHKCLQLCLQSGFIYAGVQYSTECFCGNEMPSSTAKLPEMNCNMKCSGDSTQSCGGFFTMNIFETGISKFVPQIAQLTPAPEEEKVRIAYLLTLNGRSLRQVHRLIKALYSPNHVFYIHVDSRQDYLYRELIKLELRFFNIRLARKRYSTIWGGASLLIMLMECMKDLLQNSNWQWDYVINLSESDFPVKTNERLVKFLTANKGKNFVKSHGRETQRFIQKQGLDKTFVECDTHMWRIGDRELPEGIQIDGGSDWVALSRNFVQYVTNYHNNQLLLGLLIIFRHTLLPAESFFHTVLRNTIFCDSYIDNNLHVTNWKRKLGCKCQYKHVVDWCGCSPNDFKPDDWPRLQATEQKLLFFARKFEPMINQAVIVKLEEWLFGSYPNDYVNLHSYWQSVYHFEDKSPAADDAALTIATSLMRINGNSRNFEPVLLKEIIDYKHKDEYKGFLIRYDVKFRNSSKIIELETRIRPKQIQKRSNSTKFGQRIKNFIVSSNYDQKEQICRNFANFLGPFSDPVVTIQFSGSSQAENHSYNLTVLWIDPAGILKDYNELHVEDSHSDSINYSKLNLKHPITPGIWTVKLIGRTMLFAQTTFLVVPILYEKSKLIKSQTRLEIINLGDRTVDLTYPNEWKQYLLSAHKSEILEQEIVKNSKLNGENLQKLIDDFVRKFYFIRQTCTNDSDDNNSLELCNNSEWSSKSLDPKSDVYSLLSRN